MRSYKKHWWFILIISIFIVISIIIIMFIWVNIINKNHQFIEEQKNYDFFYNRAKDNVEVISKYDKNNNINWLWNDVLTCSWWLIHNSKFNWAVCQWIWTTGYDWIDDVCNNDDETPYFADKNISLWNFFDSDSLLQDDDADARIFNIWFIYPWEQKTVFYFDKNIADKIIWNPFNKYYSLPEVWKFVTMHISIKWWVAATWALAINTRNGVWDDYFINQKQSNISLESSWTLSTNANFDWSQPYLLELNSDKTYIINISNPTGNIINYEITLRDNMNLPVYQIPITNNDYGINIPYYEWSVWEYDLQMRKINIYTKNR